jgi:nicotinate-nucleotide--dimethylbenzimidazole phosphoribosyltransferase
LGSAQARPQAPQLAALVRVLVSQPLAAAPSQSPKPAAQPTIEQAPAPQPLAATLASAQTDPQALQLAGSIAVFAQYADGPAPQARRGEAQVVPQAPPEQTWPATQAAWHAPQLALSLRASTSQPLAASPSQSRKPAAQAAIAQTPAPQPGAAWGSAQARPQAPQFAALAVRSTSQPFAGLASQSPKPAPQRTTVHAPPAQPLAATWASAQAAPHAPQFAGSMALLAQKADGPAPQARSGAAQLVPHAPAEHTRPAAQAVPHAPQLALSLRVSTSQPLAALPSQSTKPVAQAATAQAPAAQVGVALGSAQARPQAPQFAALVRVSVSQPLAAAPSQSPEPASQRSTVQAPPVQPWAATLASAQAVPHAPQLAGSMAALAQ